MIREIISNDYLTLILFGSFFLLIILKKVDPNIFDQNLSFLKKESRNTFSKNYFEIKFSEIIFNILFISNLSLIMTFIYNDNFENVIYVNFFVNLIVFFSLKILLDLFVGILFSIKKLMKKYIYLKLVFNNSLGVLLLFFNFFIAYSNYDITLIFTSLTLIYFIFSYFLIFFSMKKVIYKNWFYFILYLCTLEIIPYYYLLSNIL
ncbi:MAG: hypothetical protein CMC36_03400 [Flavobacteriaceae bacterium]|nr:hypothetical protein [Flavobacteriaceae bacterium]|tara:strand:+ start:1320 stop:1934 length:615 start_codon:yes stop_codon:yes gene_type:complete